MSLLMSPFIPSHVVPKIWQTFFDFATFILGGIVLCLIIIWYHWLRTLVILAKNGWMENHSDIRIQLIQFLSVVMQDSVYGSTVGVIKWSGFAWIQANNVRSNNHEPRWIDSDHARMMTRQPQESSWLLGWVWCWDSWSKGCQTLYHLSKVVSSAGTIWENSQGMYWRNGKTRTCSWCFFSQNSCLYGRGTSVAKS